MSCPICGKNTDRRFRPFCSRRCADVDLGKWMRGDYAVPAQDPEDIEGALEELEAVERSGRTDLKPH